MEVKRKARSALLSGVGAPLASTLPATPRTRHRAQGEPRLRDAVVHSDSNPAYAYAPRAAALWRVTTLAARCESEFGDVSVAPPGTPGPRHAGSARQPAHARHPMPACALTGPRHRARTSREFRPQCVGNHGIRDHRRSSSTIPRRATGYAFLCSHWRPSHLPFTRALMVSQAPLQRPSCMGMPFHILSAPGIDGLLNIVDSFE